MCIELDLLEWRGLDRRDEVVDISDSERLRFRYIVTTGILNLDDITESLIL